MEQLEFQIKIAMDEPDIYLQNQIRRANEGVDTIRRKLFAEVGELRKHNVDLRNELQKLKSLLYENLGVKQEWLYLVDGNLVMEKT